MDNLDKIYYMRAFLGSICGVILGIIFSTYPKPGVVEGSVWIIIPLALLFYIITYAVAKRIGSGLNFYKWRFSVYLFADNVYDCYIHWSTNMRL